MKRLLLTWMSVVVVAGLSVGTVHAMRPFMKAFDKKYVKDSGDEAFQAAFKEASCLTCHVKDEPSQPKKRRNAYGQALAKLIPGDAQERLDKAKEQSDDAEEAEKAKLLKELTAAFTQVENEKSPAGPTYGELLKQHKLPISSEP